MANSKRSLYIPAPSQTPPPQTRKSLAQGILASAPTTVFASSSTAQGETSEQRQQLSTPGYASQTASMLLEQDGRSSRSAFQQQTESRQDSAVLLVDASSRHKSPDLAEVPVITSIVKSPVRVVCHSPRGMMKDRVISEKPVVIQRSDASNAITGDTEAARRVEISGVPSVNMHHLSVERKEASPNTGSPDSLPLICPEDSLASSIGESPGEHKNIAADVRVVDGQRKEFADQFKSFLGEEGNHPPLSSHLSTSEIKQQLFDFSDIQSQQDSRDTDQSSLPSDERPDKKLKKKKQKTRIVPSRYMDKAKAATKETIPANKKKTKGVTNTKSNDQPSLPHENSKALDLDVVTPYLRRSYQQKGVVTSTPADGIMPVNPSDHIGAPTPILPQGIATSGHSSSLGLPGTRAASYDKQKSLAVSKKAVKAKGPSQAGKHVEPMTKPCPSSEHGNASTEGNEVSQRQLELQFSRVVQASFLYSKLKHSFTQKEKDAQTSSNTKGHVVPKPGGEGKSVWSKTQAVDLSPNPSDTPLGQIYSVWQEKEKLQREVSNLELELRMKTKIAELDRQLQLQMSGLKPVGSHMVKLILEFSQLAAALDTTRHHMSVNGVLMPANHDELIVVLDDSERLLGEIDTFTKQKQQQVSSFATEIEGLSKTVESEIQEQKRCHELLAAASTLSTQERSLQAQSIMDGL